ncbi:Uma2 family endonuclease [Streptomyces ipomoeae]|uniref:Uma2 family endonuclease n=1 Tax=Streptomyces ipomoeae TaxID=103232 RepID=UPI0011466EAC|nr:Uma2 family endonuclease [Streptomyces ipomoeae]MDX2935395.1 Uma2 family endonuclease [Streptomyces ipomoeae]TQE19990.1 Uma2 family endonuclease [Streptomyces ipomoeae]
MDRSRAQLTRLEGLFPGWLTEIVEGNVVASPVSPHHGGTIHLIWNSLEARLGAEWGVTSDVAFPFDGENEFCPDLAVIPVLEVEKNEGAYPPDLIALVVEVVSRASRRRDYEIKPYAYASRGIANYLIFDPLKGHVVTMWNPGPDGYRGRDTIPYGVDLTVDSTLGKLMIPTDRLPVDPKARSTE